MSSHIIQHDYIHPCENWYQQNLHIQTKVKVTSFTEIVTTIQIVSRKVQQIAQATDKGISSKFGGKRFKLLRPAPFKI